MRKSTKGALAGVAAVALLLGGFGTRANWTATGVMDGTGIRSGSMSLTAGGCGEGWLLTTAERTLATFAPATDKLVPGDVLEELCTFTVKLDGEGLAADLRLTAPTLGTGDLLSELHATASYALDGEPVDSSGPVEVEDGTAITADIKVDFDKSSATNTSQDITNEALNSITVTIDQA